MTYIYYLTKTLLFLLFFVSGYEGQTSKKSHNNFYIYAKIVMLFYTSTIFYHHFKPHRLLADRYLADIHAAA